MTNLSDHFQRLTGERSNRAIATRIDVDPSTLNRQLNGATAITVETVVAMCREYHLDFADAFIAAGFITPEEADTFADSRALSRIPDLDLAREIVRRLEAGEATAALTDPIDVDSTDNVAAFPQRNVGDPAEDLAEAAWGSDIDHSEDTDDYHA